MNQKLLLLSCCAPCSCGVITRLAGEKRDFAVLFYNPNIMPFEEYLKRKEENKKICVKYGVPFFDLDYENEAWLSAVAGLEGEPERGERCKKCFRMRLERAARFAKENGFEVFTSALGISRHKDIDDVNAAAKEVSASAGVGYDFTDWRLFAPEQTRRRMIKEENIYNQNYCGCKFSKR